MKSIRIVLALTGMMTLVLATLITFVLATAAQGETVSRYELLDDCFIEMPEDVPYDCGYVTVPEFHDGRSDNTITLGVVRLLSQSDSPEAPIFFGAGGPGGSVMQWAPATVYDVLFNEEGPYAQLLQTRDLVYFTQRGTQYASPFLNCPEELEAQDLLSQTLTFDEHLRLELEVLTACRDRLSDEGVNFDAFNSLENAADVDAIRQVLGYNQIVFYGESYGTILAQHIMRNFPDILESVILDGTASLSITSWEQDAARKYQITLERVVALCEASPACDDTYPNFANNLDAVFEQAQMDPLEVSVTTPSGETFDIPVNEEVLASTLYTNLYVPTSIAKYPLVLQEMLEGETQTFQQFYSLANAAFSDMGTMMHFAVVCSEDPVTSDEEVILPEGDAYAIAIEHAAEGIASYASFCELIDVAPIDETDQNVTVDIPTLVLSGALDPATPNFRSDEVADALPNSFTVLFPYGSHVQAAPGEECPAEIIAQFVADPFTEPDASCVETLPAITFDFPEPTLEDILGVPMMLTLSYIGDDIVEWDGSNYSLTFSEEGVTIQADCNTVNATYLVDEGDNILISLNASTLASCGPDSIADSFLLVIDTADLTILNTTPEGKINLIVIASDGTGSLTFSN